MTIKEFVNFIKTINYKNINLSQINELDKFINESEINKKRTIEEISSTFNLNEEDVKKIVIYYNSKNKNIKMSIKEFITFI